MVRIPMLILAGVLSAPLMEIAGYVWLQVVPLEMDLTAHYFSMVVLPMALLVHFLICLTFWKAFEPTPRLGAAVYVGTHVVAQATLLSLLENPLADIGMYCLMLLVSGSLTQFVFNRYFWCPQCAGPIFAARS